MPTLAHPAEHEIGRASAFLLVTFQSMFVVIASFPSFTLLSLLFFFLVYMHGHRHFVVSSVRMDIYFYSYSNVVIHLSS